MGRHGCGVVVVALVFSGCSHSNGRATIGSSVVPTLGTAASIATTQATRQTTTAASPAAEAAVSRFGAGAGVDADFAMLEDAVHADPDGVRAAALRHLGDAGPMVHYAAAYALARTAKSGESIEALKGLLVSADVNDRLMAAAALVYRGDSTGIPVLIDELGAPDLMALRDPPETASVFASKVLLRFTREDFGLRSAIDPAGAAVVKPAWRQWWNEQRAVLGWDPATEEFH